MLSYILLLLFYVYRGGKPVFPGCRLARTLKEAPKKGKGRMHKLVWFSHEKGTTKDLLI